MKYSQRIESIKLGIIKAGLVPVIELYSVHAMDDNGTCLYTISAVTGHKTDYRWLTV